MQIGEFAKLCGTNISVLRYYDKIGLLSPAFTDVVTGYRYYAPGQERVFRTITLLGEAGFSLKEIGRVLANVGNEEALSAAFAAKQTQIAEMLRALSEVQIYMKGMNEMEEEEFEFNESLEFPFADDPAAVGKWTVLGLWRSRDDFYLGKQPDESDYGDKEQVLYFLAGGEKYWVYSWTKGRLLIEEWNGPRWETYTIEEIDGETYMLIDHKSYEYLVSGKTELVVMKKTDPRAWTRREIARTDDTDMPFADDPAVIGKWKAWNFIRRKEDFSAEGDPEGYFYWKSVEFFPGGHVTSVYEDDYIEGDDRQTWTKRYLLRKFNDSACEYEIRTVDGVDYLIVEWKSGDWRFGGYDTNYYIFKREDADA